MSRLRLRGVELNGAGRPAAAARVLRRAGRILAQLPESAAATDLATRVAASLAHSEAELGHVDVAEEMLRAVMGHDAGPEATGILFNQRGLLLLRRGRIAAAVADLGRAVEELSGTPGSQCAVLLNRSAAHLYRGDARAARDDLERCVVLATRHEQPVLGAKARHNLGYLALLGRDVPTALGCLDAAHEALAEPAPGYCGVIRLDRARVLRDAGLLADADADLRAAVEVLAAHHLDQDLAEAHLVRAEVALLAGRPAAALTQARAARRRFRRMRNEAWELLAELVIVQAGAATPAAAAKALPSARDLALRLAKVGLADDARFAALVADRVELRAGGRPEPPAVHRGDRIALRLQARLVRSDIARAGADPATTSREIRLGLADLHRYRGGLGSHELRAGAGLLGRQLVDAALRDALRDGRPPVVHRWVERARAVSLRMEPVRPPDDEVVAAALTEIRAIRDADRAAQLAGRRPDPGIAARRAGLETLVRRRTWHAHPHARATPDRVAGLGEVRSALDGGALVSFLAVDATLHALVATGRAAAVVRLGGLAEVTAAVTRLRADLDVLARGPLPERIRQVVEGSLAAGLAALDAALWRPLAGRTGAGPVVLVPTGVLSSVPWTALPGLHGRPLTVAPSATWWCAGERGPVVGTRVVVAGGPGLRRAADEVAAVAARRPGATALLGAEATVERVLDEAGRAGILHLAAHGRHEPQNPLFSSVDLAGGPLFGHDLPRAGRLPAHVVLSACDVGLAVVGGGDEPLGMTAAFLQAGTRSVVASVAAVGDDVACEAMTGYHGHLAGGRSPAEALAATVERLRVTRPGEPVPFVAYGAAW